MAKDEKDKPSEGVATKSIINPKYAGKYRGASDWIGEVIEKNCYVTPEGGGPAEMNVPAMIQLLRDNHDVQRAVNYTGLIGQRNNGFFRMNISNMLRAIARKRGGLFIGDKWHKAPEGFEVYDPLRETKTGEKIKKAVAAAAKNADKKEAEEKAAA